MFANALYPIVVKPSFSTIVSNNVHPLNAFTPIVCTLSPSITDLIERLPLNASLAIATTGYPSIVLGILTAEALPVYAVIVTFSFEVVYVK